MNKADVLRILSEPDRILPRGMGMVSRAWSCSTCRKLHQFPEPVGAPAPCECGGIAFEKRAPTVNGDA
jgi:hypothetical protein